MPPKLMVTTTLEAYEKREKGGWQGVCTRPMPCARASNTTMVVAEAQGVSYIYYVAKFGTGDRMKKG